MQRPTSEALNRGAGAFGLAVGVGAALSPAALMRLYGVDPDEMTGVGALGWRLFAARNLVVGGAALRGVPLARDAVLLIQVPDQVVFAHALVTGSIPRRTALAAMASSGVVIGLEIAARRKRG